MKLFLTILALTLVMAALLACGMAAVPDPIEPGGLPIVAQESTPVPTEAPTGPAGDEEATSEPTPEATATPEPTPTPIPTICVQGVNNGTTFEHCFVPPPTLAPSDSKLEGGDLLEELQQYENRAAQGQATGASGGDEYRNISITTMPGQMTTVVEWLTDNGVNDPFMLYEDDNIAVRISLSLLSRLATHEGVKSIHEQSNVWTTND